MTKSILAIYENGAFHPLEPVPCQDRERVLLRVERASQEEDLLDQEFHAYCDAEADDTVALESVRQALGKIPGSLADDIRAEREKR